jgi:hypothetical protein
MTHKKVSVALNTGLHPMGFTPNGIHFNEEFTDALRDKEEELRSKIILQINDVAGDSWGVYFNEYPVNNSTLIVDIKSDQKFYRQIVNIITEAYPQVSFMFFETSTNLHLGSVPRKIIDPEFKASSAYLIQSRWPS